MPILAFTASSVALVPAGALAWSIGWILLIRHIVGNGLVEGGVLAGLADPRLSGALIAMHETPQRNWSLEDLADAAGMSRTRFAGRFRDVVGQTAIAYLAGWRMQVASGLLAKGSPVKGVASTVGYDDPAAFSRAFSKVIGCSPREWIAKAALRVSA